MEQQRNEFDKYNDADNEVWSAFCKTQFPSIEWKMIDTNSFDAYYGVDQLVTATTKNKQDTYNVELKMRPFPAYNVKYVKDCFLEVNRNKKIDRDGKNKKKIYVAIYPYIKGGGYIFIWDLTKFSDEDLEQYRCTEKMNKRTCESRDEKDKVEKDVYKLPTSLAKAYPFETKQFYEGLDLK